MQETKRKKKTNWGQVAVMAAFVLIGCLCGSLTVRVLERFVMPDTPAWQELLMLAVYFLVADAAITAQMVIHEAGHLVFGLLSGYRFSSFRIFSFMWVKQDGKLKFRRLTIAGTGGQCLMAPPDMVDGKIPVVLYNLGGSLMNIIFGGIFLLLYFLLPEKAVLQTVLLALAVIGFGSAAINGIPLRMGTVDNDGYNALSLSGNQEAMRAFWVQLQVNAQIAKGVRLKDMPEEWFAVPSDEAMKNSMTAVVGVFACNRLMDAGKFAEADALMAHLLELDSGIVGLHRGLMICDRMYLELIGDNRPHVLEAMQTKEQKALMRQMKKFPSVLRTQYAYALLSDRDPAGAEKIKARFEKVGKTYPYPNDVQSERELMQLAHQRWQTAEEQV